jgi:hypothetical protein
MDSNMIIILWGVGAVVGLYFSVMILSIPFKVWSIDSSLKEIIYLLKDKEK